jgi:hypothetical protein
LPELSQQYVLSELQDPKIPRRLQRPVDSSQQAAVGSPHLASRAVRVDGAARTLVMRRETATEDFMVMVARI